MSTFGGGFGDFGGGDKRPMMSEINVTPLVDVMLVLLIIFMVAAPMMTQGLAVELPKVDADAIQTDQTPTILTIKPGSFGYEFYIDEMQVPNQDVGFKVKAVMDAKKAKTVFLRADKNIPSGEVAGTMGNLLEAGITSVSLVTEPGGAKPEEETVPPAGQAAPVRPAAPAARPAGAN